MATTGAHGRKLEISVRTWRDISANIQGQKLYVAVRYGDKNCRTKIHKGGRTDVTFDENFKFELIDGQHEIDIAVWRKHTLGKSTLVAFRKIDLDAQVLGGQKSRKKWILQCQPRNGADIRNVGEVYLEMDCPVIQLSHPSPLHPNVHPSAPYGYPAHG